MVEDHFRYLVANHELDLSFSIRFCQIDSLFNGNFVPILMVVTFRLNKIETEKSSSCWCMDLALTAEASECCSFVYLDYLPTVARHGAAV